MEEKQVSNKTKIIFVILLVVVLLTIAGMVTGIILLSKSTPEQTGKIRDIFLIIMTFEFLLIGLALLVLIVLIAVMINVIQTEITPILVSTQETMKTVKGTSQFISDKAVKPILSISGLFAGFRKLLALIGIIRK